MEEKSWTPWDTSKPSIMEDYLAAQVARAAHINQAPQILTKVSKKYKKIRIGALEGSQKYTKEYLESTNKKYESFLKQIIEIYGWPTEEKFDEQCAEGAWLIAQHAENVEFQQECLQELSKAETISALQHHAYLLDLIQVKQGQPQHFGTQTDLTGNPYPIQGYTPNPANLAETELQLEMVNKRRESVGFLSLQDEQAKLSQFILMQKLLTDSHEPQPSESAQ